MGAAIVQPSPKKARTPQTRTLALHRAIALVASDYDRLSIRQLFYQLVSRGTVEKTEHAYKRVCDAATQMRLAGSLDYRQVVDGHRTRHGTYAHDGIQAALESTYLIYRRDYWLEQPTHIEVWSEKDALSGVIHPVCDRHGVPYVATRGFPSVTLIFESAQAITATGKPARVFYFGDHDASGQSISAGLERDLRGHGADVTVERMALNPDQIAAYQLPTRPGKQSDSRHAAFAARFGDASVELDALPPDALTRLVEDSIWAAIDPDAWEHVAAEERLDKRTLGSFAALDITPGRLYTATEVAS